MPDWKDKYLDFPEIPDPKKWNDSGITDEQLIVQKLIEKQDISKEEELKLQTTIEFYKSLNEKLKIFDFKSIDNLEDFKNYIFYAFNFIAIISNKLTINRTYRLVENEKILHKDERIRYQNYLSYPTKDIVKQINKFNRANTTDTNVFYGAETIDSALKEVKPEIGKRVTIGVWVPKIESPLISYPISHYSSAKVNYGAKRGEQAFEELKKNTNSFLSQFMDSYFSLLGQEYSKQINDHFDYIVSALFSDQILGYDTDPSFKFDCIIYPSVGNDFLTDNVAIKPDIFDSNYKLSKAIEFRIKETRYDEKPNNSNPDLVTLVDYTDYEETDWIDNDGYIVWDK